MLLHAVSDVDVGGWTRDSGQTTNLYVKIAEGIAAADGLFIVAPQDTDQADYQCRIDSMPADFATMTGLTINLRWLLTSPVVTKLVVSAPATATGGNAISMTVIAQDDGNNTITGYAGTVHFTSSDTLAVLPANAALTSGTGTFSATLSHVGTQTISAVYTVTASITGVSAGIVFTNGVWGSMGNATWGSSRKVWGG